MKALRLCRPLSDHEFWNPRQDLALAICPNKGLRQASAGAVETAMVTLAFHGRSKREKSSPSKQLTGFCIPWCGLA